MQSGTVFRVVERSKVTFRSYEIHVDTDGPYVVNTVCACFEYVDKGEQCG